MRYYKQVFNLCFFFLLANQTIFSQSIDLKSLTNLSTMNVVQAEKMLFSFGFNFSNIDANKPGLSIYRNKIGEEIRFSAVDKKVDLLCRRPTYMPIHDALIASNAKFNEGYFIAVGDFVYLDLKHIFTISQNLFEESPYTITVEKR